MADNQFSVKVPNIYESLMAGEQGYKDVSGAIKERQLGQAREQAAQDVMQGGNPQNALARLLQVGDDKGAATLASVIHNKQQGDFQQQQLAQQGSQFQTSSAESARHNKATEALTAEAQNKPVSVSPGAELVNPKTGQRVYGDQSSLLYSPDELKQLAQQARAGDNTVLQNARIGHPANLVNLRREIVRQNSDAGEGGAEQAARNAEYFGTKSAARTVGVKGANIDLAATEFNQVLPVIIKASQAVSRTNYPDLNKIIQAYNEKTGDPNIVAFGGGVNTLVNIYARAISPQGVGTVSDKEHAREILSKAWSQGQFDAAVGMMKQEIDAALASPEKVREEQRKRFLSGVPGAKQPASSPTATPQENAPAVKWRVIQ